MAHVDNAKLTFRRLRRIIGYLGIALPLVLILSTIIDSYVEKQPSISHYYYTNMRDVFTGILSAVGLFLIRYKGHRGERWWKNDNLLTNIAGGMAFGVALVPTNPESGVLKVHTLIPVDVPYLGLIHYGFAGLLFIIFATLSLFVFTIGQERSPGVPISIFDENHIYVVCGIVIICCIVMIPLSEYLFPFRYATYVFELIALLAFSISWLIKGRAFGDEGKTGEMFYGERNPKRRRRRARPASTPRLMERPDAKFE